MQGDLPMFPSATGGFFSNYSALTSEIDTLRNIVQARAKEPSGDSNLETTYKKHLEWRYRNIRFMFWNLTIQSWLILAVAFSLIAGGVYFAFLQLKQSFLMSGADMQTELTFDLKGVFKISSGVIGGVVLVVSLFFFYLFLKYIYVGKDYKPAHLPLSETDYFKLVGEQLMRKKGKTIKQVLDEALSETTQSVPQK
jgi:hypothetical protein